ncbi:MAG TPA: universal stress protein [Sphingobium sp.]|jgi:universal stress protein G|uniref:universal stress protein n=1 Tax=unclassified Sphingobium TaxID=2611147 RepID=UPI0007F3DEAF|nr:MULTISPECIES: universal stress protein [unclassified Sphingobium]OAN56141.1 universal stress protein [Sphingobium sp. TCM1]HAF42539.1 universal stress protein [Sphingobium sp.]
MSYATILVAVDIDNPALAHAAMASAAEVAGAQGQVHILYVRHHLPTRYSALLASDFDEREGAEARAHMKAWADETRLDPARTRFVTHRGRVRDEVLNEAESCKADLIILASHQPSLVSRLLGSNASAIVHQSPISVLVVRVGEK